MPLHHYIGMRHKWLTVLMLGWSGLMFEHAMQTWLVEGSSSYNYYYFASLLGLMAQIGAITSALGAALRLLEPTRLEVKHAKHI